LEALDKSVNDFTAEVEVYQTRRQDASTTIRLEWMVENARKAHSDLRTFFKNISLYSAELVPNYIWISCIFKDADAGN